MNAKLIAERAELLIRAIYAEYPEGLPFYCRDEVQALDDAVQGNDDDKELQQAIDERREYE